jgi:hypothetical protein
MARIDELEDAFTRVETARAEVVSIIHDALGPLLASNKTPHAGKMREISVGVTELETGCLWLANARAILSQQMRDEQAKQTEQEAIDDERAG